MENSEYLQCLIDFPLASPPSLSSLEPPTSHFTGWSEGDINQLDSFDFPLSTPLSLSSSEPPTSHFTGWSEEDINQLDYSMSTTPGKIVEQQHQDIHPLISDPESEIKSKKKPRRKSVPWTKDEHRLFLLGLQEFGKGDWKNISRYFVVTKDAIQVASHAQKYFIRRDNPGKYSGRKSSIFDIHTIDNPIEPKSQRNQSYIPIAPSPLPPSPPIIQSRIDYNLLQGSGTRNRYHPSNLSPIENFSYQADPVNMENFPSSATYSLDEPWSSSQSFGTFSFANNM